MPKKRRVINVSEEVYQIISDYCQATGKKLGEWSEEILMDEMRRVLQKRGKRVEPLHPEGPQQTV